MRGSGTLTVPTWVSGISEPYASTTIGSSRLALARPVRRPCSSLRRTSSALSMRLLEIRQVGLPAAHDAASSLMMVWGPSPRRTRANAPGACTENTMMGMLLSRASEIAEASITLRSCASTSR